MNSAIADRAGPAPARLFEDEIRRYHLWVLWASVAIVGLAGAMVTVDSHQVAFAGFAKFPLPELCQSRRWLGLECPGCGLTRSFIHFFHGRWQESLAMHRLGWLMALLVALQIPYRLIAISTPGGEPLGKIFPWLICSGLVIWLAINWLATMYGI